MGTRMRTAARRGQALVETALGLLVFVTLLMFGIYFAEVGALTLKVQEAANFALWEATGHVQHDPDNAVWQRDLPVAQAASAAAGRYRDFDGRASQDRGGMTIQLAFARARPIQVACRPNLPGGGAIRGITTAGIAPLSRMNFEAEGISCQASSSMEAARLGEFMQPEFFRVSTRRATRPFTVCAAGRAGNDGVCDGQFAMLLDDWGLSSLAEGRSCALNIDNGVRCQNTDYYQWAEDVFEANGGAGNAGTALAGVVGATVAIDEGQFFMSFRGEEDDYEENLGATHAGGQTRWEVTPFLVPPGGPAYNTPRQGQWLGGVPH